jgi:hypothetical protein
MEKGDLLLERKKATALLRQPHEHSYQELFAVQV